MEASKRVSRRLRRSWRVLRLHAGRAAWRVSRRFRRVQPSAWRASARRAARRAFLPVSAAASRATGWVGGGLARLRARFAAAPAWPRDVAWTFAAVTGALGMLFLVLLQLAQTRPTAGAIAPAVAPPGRELLADPAKSVAPAEPAPAVIEAEPVRLELAFHRLPADSPDEFLVVAETTPPEPGALHTTPHSLLPGDEWDVFDESRTPLAFGPFVGSQPVLGAALSRLDPADETDGPDEPGDALPGEVSLEILKRLPERAVVHQPLDYEIIVRNDGDKAIERLVVEDHVASEHRVAGISDGGLLDDQTLRWQLRGLKPGQAQTLSVRVVPTEAGPAESTATARPFAAVSASTLVQSAKLQLEVTAPERVRLGAACPLVFRVTNSGPVPATGVVIREDVPSGLEHPLGRELDFAVGTLEPGETREARLVVLASETGVAVNQTEVVADGGLRQAAAQRLEVHLPSFSIRRVGLERASVGRILEYTNHVTNETDAPLEDIEIIEIVPPGMEVVRTGQEGRLDQESRTIRWRVSPIEPGATAQVVVALRPTAPGVQTSEIVVRNPRERLGPLVAPIRIHAAPAAAGCPTGGHVPW